MDGAQTALQTVLEGFVSQGAQATVLADRIADLGIPILVVWGAEDQIIPAGHAAALGGKATIHVIEGRGHMVHMEGAGEVNRLLADHLS
jgi:pyruvate dehydrogenase E2 component (dihydrolipoamide acetyltransferase)